MSTETHATDDHRPELEALLPLPDEPAEALEARIDRIARHRRRSPERSAELDRFLVERHARLESDHRTLRARCDRQRAAIAEAMTAQREVRELLRAATAPPLLPAVYLETLETPRGRLALVAMGAARRLVHAGEDVDLGALEVGQGVYLGREMNAIVCAGHGDRDGPGEAARVDRVLDDGRLVLLDRDARVLVRASGAMRDAAPEPGDTVRWNRELMLAYETVPVGEPDELLFTEFVEAGAEQALGGLDGEVEAVVGLFTRSIADPELARRYGLDHGNSLLMHGPPGNGKTSIARLVASALASATGERCRFASVKGAQLESQWVGSSQSNIRELFHALDRDGLPAILFIDEIDAIGRTRGSLSGHHSDKFLSSWLTELDGLGRRRPIGVIATTNRKDLVDQALLERVSGMELFVGRPDLEAAREIFAVHLPASLPYGADGTANGQARAEIVETAVSRLYSPNADNRIAELRLRDGTARTVAAREILSGRTIAQICSHARRSAFTRHAGGAPTGLCVEDVEAAVEHAIARLSTTLGPRNAHALLPDLPQDVDVVAVEPVRRPAAAHRYLHAGGGRG